MKLSVKYTIKLAGLQKCPHDWDCCSLRANAAQCAICRVLFSIVRLHFTCRLEWSLHSLSSVDDYVHLLPTSNMFQDLLLHSDVVDDADPKTGFDLEVTVWVLWTPLNHPIVADIIAGQNPFPLRVTVQRSRPVRGIWYRDGTRLLNRWLQNSLAKLPGAIYSQLPDPQIALVPETTLPTRVLDLMPDGLIQQIGRSPDAQCSPFVRLAVPQPGMVGRYLTLSHRWGPTRGLLQLTRSNLGQLKEGILLQCLPKTFRDAATVAAELGYRYLWIDALCIIQDDQHDWLRESENMCTVYRNSCCTIAAHTSLGSNDGFLGQSYSERRDSFPLWSRCAINCRGWVFQERILSRRILHFTRGIYDPHRQFLPNNRAAHPMILHDAKPNIEDVIEKSTQWYRLVERYARCELTYDTDRLPAVAGLAKYYQELSGAGPYAYGLWLSSIHQGLLWVETGDGPVEIEAMQDGSVPKSPSWSWGLWRSEIRYPYHLTACTPVPAPAAAQANDIDNNTDKKNEAEVVHHPQLQVPLISVSDDRILTLRLPIVHWRDISARRKAKGIDKNNNCPSFPKIPLDNLYDLISLPANQIRPNWVAFDGQRANVLRYRALTVALLAANVKVDYFFWVEDEDNQQHKSEERLYYFLILERVITGKGEAAERRYKRVGVGAVRKTSWWEGGMGGGGTVQDVEIE
ncbi:heterokaryon incompatibility protein-domain-containing protein [Apodospora peruviana]|uniref:Heterokaryon incompatibility protein-domain-containing protein n=1 Tax=Apodospora peruviana TaxID=516989 RepID=A0AAE0IB43_9PEZI|nr:heterokaryon incompatibility protein-domain-containing protein [Apodospora peruviana]